MIPYLPTFQLMYVSSFVYGFVGRMYLRLTPTQDMEVRKADFKKYGFTAPTCWYKAIVNNSAAEANAGKIKCFMIFPSQS